MSGRARRAHTAAAPALWPPHLSRLHGVQLLHSSLDGRVRPGGVHRSQRCALHQWVRVGRPAAGVGRLPHLILVIRWRCIGVLALQGGAGELERGLSVGWCRCFDLGAWQACWIRWEDGKAGNNGGASALELRRRHGAAAAGRGRLEGLLARPKVLCRPPGRAGPLRRLAGLSERTWGAPGCATAAMACSLLPWPQQLYCSTSGMGSGQEVLEVAGSPLSVCFRAFVSNCSPNSRPS